MSRSGPRTTGVFELPKAIGAIAQGAKVYWDNTNKGHDAAAMVWSKAPWIIRAFDEGAVIKSKSGFWLAIPTEQAPKRGVGGKRINPSNFPEHRFGPLRFVYRRGRPSLLVVDGVRVNMCGRVGRRANSGAFTKTGRMKQDMATSVMFIMLPRVRLKKRLNVRREIKRWEIRLPELIGGYLERV
ncbi:MAG TPA: DUF2190 family protein [Rhodospirillaceae bacterium]|nr:DUF2190 family protein [Rhodospirillaceae bacterium]